MFTLNYYTLDEKTPDHQSKVLYYILNNTHNHSKNLIQKLGDITYEWFSSCGEVNDYYDEVEDKDFKIGDTKPWKYYNANSDDDRDSHATVILMLCLDGQPLWIAPEDPDFVPVKMAWNYAHDALRESSKYVEGNYFPAFDINNLLREGLVKIISAEKVLVGREGNQYYQVYANVEYKGEKYNLRMSQDKKWSENAWTTDENGVVSNLEKVDIFSWTKI